MNQLNINFKRIKDNAIVPTRGSEFAAGLDLYACLDDEIRINPQCTRMIGTGIAIQLPHGTCGLIIPRSGIATKQDMANINAPGLIDEDYTGELIVALHNYGGEVRVVHPGERIAQLLITPYYFVQLFEVEKLEKTERGENGFGSTGLF